MAGQPQWHPAEPQQEPPDVVVEGGRIEQARWLTVRAALSLEIRGMTRHGRSARVLANEICGTHHRTARAAYVALDQKITAELGEQFGKPLPPR